MIGKIKGTLTEFFSQEGLIETSGGVFYRIFLPVSFRSLTLPAPVEVYTYLHVREDALILYGFESRQKLELFSLFHSVQGVGPKTAFTMTSFVHGEEMRQAIQANDVSYFTRIPGLGKKTAVKMIVELSSKLKQEVSLGALHMSEDDESVLSGLTSLGFSSTEVRKIMPKIDAKATLEERITQGIRLLTQKQ